MKGDCFANYDASSWAAAIDSAAPSGIIIAAATPQSKDVAARIAARRGLSIVQDVVAIDGMNLTSPIYSGKAMQTVALSGDAAISVRANVFPAAASSGANVSVVDQSGDVATAVQEIIARASTRLDVAEANIIISGGRGMGSPDNFSHLEKIADVLGAAVGASRAAVDTWDDIPHSMQVGQTGKTVNPNLNSVELLRKDVEKKIIENFKERSQTAYERELSDKAIDFANQKFATHQEILRTGKPHLGTDRLVRILQSFRRHLFALGVEIRFSSKVTRLLVSDKNQVYGVEVDDGSTIECESCVLAIGHSAREIYDHLQGIGVSMESKPFAVGFRVEHPQDLINRIQYGDRDANLVNQGKGPLPVADYKLATDISSRGIYSFCMCPCLLYTSPSPRDQRGARMP